jgi:hypothetical protein
LGYRRIELWFDWEGNRGVTNSALTLGGNISLTFTRRMLLCPSELCEIEDDKAIPSGQLSAEPQEDGGPYFYGIAVKFM